LKLKMAQHMYRYKCRMSERVSLVLKSIRDKDRASCKG
jgi:hypothetical protein